jgi:hypothetical protein
LPTWRILFHTLTRLRLTLGLCGRSRTRVVQLIAVQVQSD